MHPVMTMKSWSHHVHDGGITTWQEIDHLAHNGTMWAAMGVALFVTAVVALMFYLTMSVP
jgi:hypothetical protein